MSTFTELQLRNFDISEDTGFVASSPLLTSLPEHFSRWEALAKNLPALIRDRRIREEVHALPSLEFSGETLTSEKEAAGVRFADFPGTGIRMGGRGEGAPG